MTATLEGWRAYAAERGNTAPTEADDALANAALVRAKDYIKYTYVARFYSVSYMDREEVDYATYEAANLELATPGFFTKTFTASQTKVLTEVKGIKWTPVGGLRNDASAFAPKSTLIDNMLMPFMSMGAAGAFWV